MPETDDRDAVVNRPVEDVSRIPAGADLAIMVAACVLFWGGFSWVISGWL